MTAKQFSLRLIGGILFVAGTTWFYHLTNKQTLLALLVILLGIETLNMGMKNNTPK